MYGICIHFLEILHDFLQMLKMLSAQEIPHQFHYEKSRQRMIVLN
tara:strand:- start:68 stop:202 length:135 start_codon:yes stop_codon:yes gene_type:complete